MGDWGLDADPAEFLATFAQWPSGPYPGAEELVARVRRSVPVGCLSNTNASHCDDHFSRWPIFDAFDFKFLSYELGLLKPDREVFDRVAELVAVPAGRILFLDDNQLNVDGARDAGFTAARANGVAEAEHALVVAGVLPA